MEEGEFFFKVEEKEEGFIENHSWARKSFFASPPPCTLPSNGAKNNLSPPISKKDPLGQVRDREKSSSYAAGLESMNISHYAMQREFRDMSFFRSMTYR